MKVPAFLNFEKVSYAIRAEGRWLEGGDIYAIDCGQKSSKCFRGSKGSKGWLREKTSEVFSKLHSLFIIQMAAGRWPMAGKNLLRRFLQPSTFNIHHSTFPSSRRGFRNGIIRCVSNIPQPRRGRKVI